MTTHGVRVDVRRSMCVLALAALGVGGAANPALGQYSTHVLVSDGGLPADHFDPHLVNPWGLAFDPTGFAWVANNHTGTSTLYDGSGAIQRLVVSIPTNVDPRGGSPTGIVFNGSSGFGIGGVPPAPARFVFASEDGIISGWSPKEPPGSTQALVVIDNPVGVYKGLAILADVDGDRLYAADFHTGTIDVYDDSFGDLFLQFVDPNLPAGYAPFNVQAIGDSLYVTYALQDANGVDDVPGPGHGFVDEFDRNGSLIRRFASAGVLNSAWGLALAPAEFGPMSGALLIGNVGDGRINAFDVKTRRFLGTLDEREGAPIQIEGLWALQFGNGVEGQPTNTLFFTAGPNEEANGIYGRIDAEIACAADCNGDGMLYITDFICFQEEWQAMTPKGDCNGDGIYNILDFVCFQAEWQAGCP
jgi:uncharacterized protein (TIGR03118 family)